MDSLTDAPIHALKVHPQRLKATLKLGKEGLSPQFLAARDDPLKHHELVKSEVRRIHRAEEGIRSTARRKEPKSFGHARRKHGGALPAETDGGEATGIVITAAGLLPVPADQTWIGCEIRLRALFWLLAWARNFGGCPWL